MGIHHPGQIEKRGVDEFNGLGFELGGVALAWFGIHPG
jgi:hypothetical protein